MSVDIYYDPFPGGVTIEAGCSFESQMLNYTIRLLAYKKLYQKQKVEEKNQCIIGIKHF